MEFGTKQVNSSQKLVVFIQDRLLYFLYPKKQKFHLSCVFLLMLLHEQLDDKDFFWCNYFTFCHNKMRQFRSVYVEFFVILELCVQVLDTRLCFGKSTHLAHKMSYWLTTTNCKFQGMCTLICTRTIPFHPRATLVFVLCLLL